MAVQLALKPHDAAPFSDFPALNIGCDALNQQISLNKTAVIFHVCERNFRRAAPKNTVWLNSED